MYQGQPLKKVVKLTLSGAPVTGVLFSQVTAKYWREGDTALQTLSMILSYWAELESGLYVLSIPASVMTALGTFYFRLTGGGVFDLYEERADIQPAPLQFLASPSKCIITGNLLDINGDPTNGNQQVVFRVPQLPKQVTGSLMSSNRIVTTPDALGNFSVSLIRGAVALVEIPQAGINVQITVPDQDNAQLLDLMPPIP